MQSGLATTRAMTSIHQLHLGHVALPDSHPRAAEVSCEIYCYAIDHPDGIVVVDTGPRSGHPIIDELYAPEVISILEALERVSLDERDVVAVVNTHLHFDHCGQNTALPNAPVWVTEAELALSTTEFYTVPEWAHIADDRLRLSNDDESIASGVRLIHTPGHTPGHQSVAVTTAIGLEIIVGQACYTCAEYTTMAPAATDMHEPEWLSVGVESLARLRSLNPVRAHFSHDAITCFPI